MNDVREIPMKPYWPDTCNHIRAQTRDKHIGILSLPSGIYDVYVYQDNAPEMHVCVRYGAEESQYLSPGEVGAFLAREWDPASLYAIVAAMIRADRSFGGLP